MSQSTPIFNIPRDNFQQNDQQSRAIQNLIDDNVDEMQQVSVDQAYQMQQMQQMQPQPMPNDFSAQMQPQFQSQQQFQNTPQQIQFSHPQPPQQMPSTNLYVPTQMRGQIDNNTGLYLQQSHNDDWSSYMMREFKDSIIIAVLFVILNISLVQRLLQLYIPYMDNVYLELVVRGVISGTLFYFLKRFWRP